MEIKIKKLRPGAVIPVRGSEYAAGYDLYACLENSVVIEPHTTVKIGTGLALAVPEGYFGAVFARSGMAAKQGLRPANCVGVCDSDYRADTRRTVENGDRIAQLVILPFMAADFVQTDELDDTSRGSGGFGSTGK